VTIEDGRGTAFAQGIVTIEQAELASGQEIEMKIEAGSGRIITLKRDERTLPA
jgi:hypothetical protein